MVDRAFQPKGWGVDNMSEYQNLDDDLCDECGEPLIHDGEKPEENESGSPVFNLVCAYCDLGDDR